MSASSGSSAPTSGPTSKVARILRGVAYLGVLVFIVIAAIYFDRRWNPSDHVRLPNYESEFANQATEGRGLYLRQKGEQLRKAYAAGDLDTAHAIEKEIETYRAMKKTKIENRLDSDATTSSSKSNGGHPLADQSIGHMAFEKQPDDWYQLDATVRWQKVLEVKGGDKITFLADPTSLVCGSNTDPCVGPGGQGGWPGQFDSSRGKFPADKAKFQSLVAKFGDGEAFEVGLSHERSVPTQSGTVKLYMMSNVWNGYENQHRGGHRVQVKVNP
jgi:hypothetical protein